MSVKNDVGMNVKMNNKCFPEIMELDQGLKIDERGIHDLLDFVDERHDCADFRVLSLVKTYWCYRDLLSEKTNKRIKKSLCSFKYWMDEPGTDGMCYWSENHQLIFHTAEYLAGSLFPEEVFSNSGMNGLEHQEKALPKIKRWLKWKFQFGFIEWNSNTYYEEDVAPLSLLIDLAKDEEVRHNAKIVMDLLFLDMALHTYQGYFVSTSGRCYEAQKQDPRKADVNDLLKAAFGILTHDYDYTRLSTLFLLVKNYQVPSVLKEIAKSNETMIIKESQGLDLKEVKEKINPHDFDNLGMCFWQMEAFTNPESIEMTMDIFNAWNLKDNNFLKDLKMINIPFLRKLRILPLLVRLLNPATAGVAIQRANIYTYRTKHYLLSSVQKYHPGEFGDQQHIWQVTLPKALSVFSTHPGSPMFDDAARNFSPSYWVGNGINPDCRQWENVILIDYNLNKRKGFLEKTRQNMVHFFFEANLFDEVKYLDQAVYARKDGSYLAIISEKPYARSANELIYKGRRLGFVIIMGDSERDNFDEFIRNNQSSNFSRRGSTIAYHSEHDFRLAYKRRFTVDNNPEDGDFPRFDTPFVHARREADSIDIETKDDLLHLELAIPKIKESEKYNEKG
ncbi:MAG: hypothetical protein PHI01_04810 [Candidatus Izemoplasmatales bacterium]|nr:hypothetical protein [Candidatus Izemoplasmatales bacterium]